MSENDAPKHLRVKFVMDTVEYDGFDPEPTAVFVDLMGYDNQYQSYSHNGQHITAHKMWVEQCTRPATPEEYAPLLLEISAVYKDVTFVVVSE